MYQNTLKVYLRLLTFVRKFWFAFSLGIVGTMLTAATDAGFTWFLKPVLDKGFVARDHAFIHWLPLMIVIGFLIRGGSFLLSNYYMTKVARSTVLQFRQQIFSHLMRLPAEFYDNHSSGSLLSVILYNVQQLAKATTDAMVTLIQESCLIIGLIIVMLTISVKLTLIFLIAIPLIALTARYAAMRMRKLSKNIQDSMGELSNVAQEAIEGYRVVRMFNGTQYEIEKFNKAILRGRFRELKIVVTNALATITVQQVAGIVIAGIIFLATRRHFQMTAGGFASMMAAMLAILKPMKSITTVSSTIQKGAAAAESIFALLDEKPEQDTGTLRFERALGKIDYRQVSFVYGKDRAQVLENINFVVNPGEKIAIVGRSGSGKSTLVNLLPRFYDQYSGMISLDDVNIRDICLEDLRQQISLVSQNITLFNDTIANNIAYGRFTNITEAEIIEAAEAAHAMEFIRQLPQGLQTVVGENGVTLSGGQRQRIAIARALLKNAPILIFDEATSSLDTESERHIQAGLATLMQGRTTIIIAHRLSTIESANKILVIDKGKIIESGQHHELLQLNGQYARLHQLQFKEESFA